MWLVIKVVELSLILQPLLYMVSNDINYMFDFEGVLK